MFRPFAFFLTILLFQASAYGQIFDPMERMLAGRLVVIQSRIRPIYRRPTKDEIRSVQPGGALAERYAEFLRQPNTGLTKLISDKGCSDNSKIVSAKDECLQYTMPGGGNSFSFRAGTYRIPRLADIRFTDNSFQASGVFVHGIFVKLGNVPVDQVSLQTLGMKFLVDFKPEPNYSRAKQIDDKLTRGVEVDGFLYRRGFYAVDDTTYALRSIAYGGKYLRANSGVTYNEFDFDKREDVIVVFRIVERDADGNVTILWKKLQEKDSPKVNRKDIETEKNSVGQAGGYF